jgi:four helix bundle protein
MQCSVGPIVQSYRDLGRLEKVDDVSVRHRSQHAAFPKPETYGLVSQLRRAAVSVPSNIAEGHARLSTGAFKQSLGQARGSLMEVETYILVARELGYLEHESSDNLLSSSAELRKILNGLRNSLGRERSQF